MSKFDNLKVGDKITRLMGGTLPMPMVVETIENGIITCGAIECDGSVSSACIVTGKQIGRAHV